MKKAEFTNQKILFTSHRAGFGNTFNKPLIKLLRDAGAKVHYASNGDQHVRNCDQQFKLPITRSPFSFDNITAYRQLKKIIETEKYDIIHCHTPTGGVITRLAARKMRKHGTKVIYTAHGFHFFKGAPRINWLVYYPIEKIMAHFTDTLITINQEDYIRAKKKLKTDVQYIPGVGIDSTKFNITMTKQQKSKLRRSLGLKDTDFVMLYPAELNTNKNQIMLIQAMEKLVKYAPNIHLLLPGEDNLENYYQSISKIKAVDNNIHFLGYRTDIPQLLQIADISVSTSLREGLPVNIMEAMCVGLPIVATDCRGNCDLVKDGINGYIVQSGHWDHFADKVIALLTTESTRLAMICKNKEVVEKYLLDKVLLQIRDIYVQSVQHE